MNFRTWVAQVIVLAILLSESFCFGQERSVTTYTNEAHGFEITLPSGWGEVPKAALDTVDERAARMNPKWVRPIFHYGYRRTDTNAPGARSVILVRVSDMGKRPDPEAVKRDILDAGGSVLPIGPSGAAKISEKDVVFDSTLNAFLATHTIQVSPEVSVGTFFAYFLTEMGVLKLTCFAPGSSFSQERQIFESVARSVRLSKELKYQGKSPSPSKGPEARQN